MIVAGRETRFTTVQRKEVGMIHQHVVSWVHSKYIVFCAEKKSSMERCALYPSILSVSMVLPPEKAVEAVRLVSCLSASLLARIRYDPIVEP